MSNALAEHGVSDVAEYLARERAEDDQRLRAAPSLGSGQLLIGELLEVWQEAQSPGWDGYDALPVARETLENMRDFLEALPPGFPPPSLAADAQGCLSAEWRRSPRRVVSVSVTAERMLYYAALLGPGTQYGSLPLFREIPATITTLVRGVLA